MLETAQEVLPKDAELQALNEARVDSILSEKTSHKPGRSGRAFQTRVRTVQFARNRPLKEGPIHPSVGGFATRQVDDCSGHGSRTLRGHERGDIR